MTKDEFDDEGTAETRALRQRLVDKLVDDPAFRKRIMEDPQEALKAAGFGDVGDVEEGAPQGKGAGAVPHCRLTCSYTCRSTCKITRAFPAVK